MTNDKGITLMTLIVTITIIIILSLIVGYYSVDSLRDTERMNLEVELRNVEELVSTNKAKIMVGAISIPSSYLATDEQINSFSSVLTSSEIDDIKSDGNYYYMNQEKFEEVFENSVSAKNIRHNYLINFADKVIISNAGSQYRVGEIE